MYTDPNKHVPVVWDERTRKRKFMYRAAEDLQVTYTHLYYVLEGKRESEALIQRIRKYHPELLKYLKKEQTR